VLRKGSSSWSTIGARRVTLFITRRYVMAEGKVNCENHIVTQIFRYG